MMKIGMIGLGRMGGNMARRLMAGGHQIVAYDRDAEAVAALDTLYRLKALAREG